VGGGGGGGGGGEQAWRITLYIWDIGKIELDCCIDRDM